MLTYWWMIFVFKLVHTRENDCSTKRGPPIFSPDAEYQCGQHGCGNYFENVIVDCYNVTFDSEVELNLGVEVMTALNISHSNISVLPHSAFWQARSISELYLENLNIETVIPGAFTQTQIKKIYFDGNNLSSVTDGIYNSLIDLDTLDLSRNRIENISEHAFEGTKLVFLNLSRNSICELGSAIKRLSYLTILDISYNNLSNIENCFGNISLKTLKVNNNKIKLLNLNHLPPITVFDISHNELEKLEIPGDDNIREIYIGKNKVTSINLSTPNLEVLDIGDNNLKNLNRTLFSNSTNLKKLYLSGNNISFIPISLFEKLIHLEELDLSKNDLSTFKFGTFDGLTYLNTLNVSHNRLKILPNAFHSLNHVQNLYLQNNELQDLNVADLLNGMNSIKTINLNYNNWDCKSLRDITLKLRKYKITIINGNNLHTNHIFGIGCNESKPEVSDKMDHDQNPNLETTKNFFNNGFKNSSFYEFFNQKFENTSFVKYFENLKTTNHDMTDNLLEKLYHLVEQNSNITSKVYSDILRNYSRLENSFQELESTDENITKKIENLINKLNEENVKSFESVLEKVSENLSNNFNRTTFRILKDLNSIHYLGTNQEKFVAEEPHVKYEYNDNHVIAIFMLVLIAIVIVILSAIGYVIIFKIKYNTLRSDIQLSPILRDIS